MEIMQGVVSGGSLFRDSAGRYYVKRTYDAICALPERPWWSRLWVAQEIVLAKHALIYCGHAKFDFKEPGEWVHRVMDGLITTAHSDEFYNHIVSIDVDAGKVIDSSIDVEVGKVIKLFSETILGLAEIILYIRGPRSDLAKQALGILCLLNKPQATELRDKVYGCLGVIDEAFRGKGTKWAEMYSQPAQVIYSMATCVLLAVQGNLYAFCFVPRRSHLELASLSKWLFEIENKGPALVAFSHLPSWSIDFSQRSDKISRINLFFQCTTGEESFSWKIEHPLLLSLQGLYFDKIVSCHHVEDDVFQSTEQWRRITKQRAFHTIWRKFFDLPLHQSEHCAYIGGGSLEDAYWRTCVADLCLDEKFEQRRMSHQEVYKRMADSSDERPRLDGLG